MKPSELLSDAKGCLWDGIEENSSKCRFICYAIDIVADRANTVDASISLKIVKEHIETLLGSCGDRLCGSLGQWLFLHHNVDYQKDLIKLQKTRLNWICDMIVYFQSKGL